MFKKIAIVTPLVFMSIGMTACSNNKVKNSGAIPTQKTIVNKAPTAAKKEIIPVVYEKRTPRARKNVRRKRVVRRSAPRRYSSSVRRGSFASKLSSAAIGRTRSRVRYDGSYVKIAYPWGDVPQNIGVCTDVVIRSYRKLGVDLQQQVHRDMSAAFNAYPNVRKWGLSKPDANIDHRRVYNLRKFFQRRGAALPISHNPRDYKPGDLVTWMVGRDLPHIGVVVNQRSRVDPNRFMIVHNIARGPQMEDVLFRFPITGHYRYTSAHMGNIPRATYVSNSRKRRGMSRTDAMNYSELLEASRILGTPSRSAAQKAAKSSKKNDPLQIAKYSDKELQALLKY